MKKTLLTLLFLSAITVSSFAQICSIDPNATGLIYPMLPDSTTNVWQDYTQTITISVPTDTSVPPLTVYIDSIFLDSVRGLPNGLTYGCNSSVGTCNYIGGTQGCFIISGNVNDTMGIYQVTIDVVLAGVLDSTGTDTNQLVIPYSLDVYKLYVGAPLGVQSLDNSIFDVLQNIPNPFNGNTAIKFNSPVNEKVDFYVYDMIGRQVYNSKISAVTGVNTINYTSEKLEPGAYFYTLANSKARITKRMIVSAK